MARGAASAHPHAGGMSELCYAAVPGHAAFQRRLLCRHVHDCHNQPTATRACAAATLPWRAIVPGGDVACGPVSVRVEGVVGAFVERVHLGLVAHQEGAAPRDAGVCMHVYMHALLLLLLCCVVWLCRASCRAAEHHACPCMVARGGSANAESVARGGVSSA